MSVPTKPGLSLTASIPVGVLATVTMDAAMVLASRFADGAFASDKIGGGEFLVAMDHDHRSSQFAGDVHGQGGLAAAGNPPKMDWEARFYI